MLVSTQTAPAAAWRRVFAEHWTEYAIEAGGLGLFMVSACVFGSLFGHPESPVVRFVEDPTLLRLLMGLAMGTTAVAIIYSSFGKRSGAHINPAATLTFWRLGKVGTVDALFYSAAHFIGAAAGVAASAAVLGERLSNPGVNYVVTLPGIYGNAWAFAAEAAIAFLLMAVILKVSNTPKFNRYTGLCAGLLVMTYIVVEAPISGMSLNPARTAGSALGAGNWTAIWIYFTAPPLGMLAAAEFHLRVSRKSKVLCAKLHHNNRERCIFRCDYPQL